MRVHLCMADEYANEGAAHDRPRTKSFVIVVTSSTPTYALRISMNRQRTGFTLIELAIVLTIIGILLAAFLQCYSVWIEQYRYNVTKQRLKNIRTALTHYVTSHERLPCPGSPWGAKEQTNSKDGKPGDTDECAPAASPIPGIKIFDIDPIHRAMDHSNEIWIGIIPTSDLRLDGEQGLDGWNNEFTYAVSRRLTFPKSMRGNPSPLGIISIVDEHGRNALDEPDTGRYVIISHGPSGAGAWTSQGGSKPCQGETLDSLNCSGHNIFVMAPTSKAAGERFYDDIVIHDDSNAGGDVLDLLVRCNAKEAFYKPQDPTADKNGCVVQRNVWQGACLRSFVSYTDKTFKAKVLLPPAIVSPAATSSSSDEYCACEPGYTVSRMASWMTNPLVVHDSCDPNSPFCTPDGGIVLFAIPEQFASFAVQELSQNVGLARTFGSAKPYVQYTELYTCVRDSGSAGQ